MRWMRGARALVLGFLSLSWTHDTLAGPIGNGHPFGLGLAAGAPSIGVSGKYYLGPTNAIEGVVGSWSAGWGDGWYLHGAYLWHPSLLTSGNGFDVPWHAGVGAFLADDYRSWGRDRWGDIAFGVRAPVGIELDLIEPRLQFSGDIAGLLFVVPALDFDIAFSISVRYFF